MIWALKDGIKIEAIPQTRANCPLCEKEVQSKCGEINVWHWAHLKSDNCDNWSEPESDWHYYWKMTFGKESAEVIIRKLNKYHIADIYTKNKVVIELQNSPIQKQIIKKREDFYGRKMIWLINGIHFIDKIKMYNWEFDSNPNERKKAERNIARRMYSNWGFSWKHPRKSWGNVERNVFIDFGGEELFWVSTGMGKSYGTGEWVWKKAFIKKYGGDYNYYCQHRFLQISGNQLKSDIFGIKKERLFKNKLGTNSFGLDNN